MCSKFSETTSAFKKCLDGYHKDVSSRVYFELTKLKFQVARLEVAAGEMAAEIKTLKEQNKQKDAKVITDY